MAFEKPAHGGDVVGVHVENVVYPGASWEDYRVEIFLARLRERFVGVNRDSASADNF